MTPLWHCLDFALGLSATKAEELKAYQVACALLSCS